MYSFHFLYRSVVLTLPLDGKVLKWIDWLRALNIKKAETLKDLYLIGHCLHFCSGDNLEFYLADTGAQFVGAARSATISSAKGAAAKKSIADASPQDVMALTAGLEVVRNLVINSCNHMVSHEDALAVDKLNHAAESLHAADSSLHVDNISS